MPSDRDKNFIRKRADFRCEYCKAPEEVTGYTFHMEHIKPRAKGGNDGLLNYALSCVTCNRAKSHHVTGTDPETAKLERLFNPRKESWDEHFRIERKVYIKGITPTGRATENQLQLNHPRQLEARTLWVELQVFP